MRCASCGRELLASETRCPACGTRAATTETGRRSAPRRFDRTRWSSTDVVAGMATLVLVVALFLPWFGISLGVVGLSVSGLDAHGYLYLVLVLGLAELAYLVARASVPSLPERLPFPHQSMLSTVNGVNLVLVLIGFANKGPTGVGWRFGAILALVAALVAALPKGVIVLARRRR